MAAAPPPSTLADLESYEVSPTTGFVPDTDPLIDLPEAFAPLADVADDLPGLLRWKRVRRAVEAMPEVDVSAAVTRHEQERVLLVLTTLANAWVWSDPDSDLRMPAQLARPLWQLARTLGRQPIVHHASMCLWNWRRIDPTEPVSADNSELLQTVMGGTDETWFFTATLGVELAGAPVLAALHDAANASANDDLDALDRHLTDVADTMPSLTAALARMREWCDPHIFYHRLRPFLAGWPDPGVVYEGVSPDPVMLAGGSAGQSSLVQALDAGLGIVHGPTAGPFLDHMRDYMPPAHRGYLADLAATSRIRHVADTAGLTGLTEAYNAAVGELELFRRRHMALAMEYVVAPSGDAERTGTGGTDFAVFLREARTDTAAGRLSAG